jgi:hypothetical protein
MEQGGALMEHDGGAQNLKNVERNVENKNVARTPVTPLTVFYITFHFFTITVNT